MPRPSDHLSTTSDFVVEHQREDIRDRRSTRYCQTADAVAGAADVFAGAVAKLAGSLASAAMAAHFLGLL
jgi:hypothetical protein